MIDVEGPEGPDSLMVKRLLVTVDRTRLNEEVSKARLERGSRQIRERESVAERHRCVVKTMQHRSVVETKKGMENVSIHDLISRDSVYPRTPSRSTERLITIPLPIFDCLRMPDPGDVC